MKNYTDIEQSKKLTEILPLESADMYYPWYIEENGDTIGSGHRISIPSVGNLTIHKVNKRILSCWSLSALLGVLPVIIGDVLSKNSLRLRIDKSETNFNVWYDNLDSGMVEEGLDIIKSNAVDACYEMIIKLHELKML